MFSVYSILNLVNGKRYIGVSNDVEDRIRHHKSKLNNNKHENKDLQLDFNSLGKENFEFSILESFDTNDNEVVADKEIYYIDLYDSCDNGYNSTGGGEGYGKRAYTDKSFSKFSESMKGNTYGKGSIRSDEQKQHYRESWHSRSAEELDAHKKRASETMKKLWQNEEFRETMKNLHTGNKWGVGRQISDEQKEKLSEMRVGENNPFYGKSHTDETKEFLSKKAKEFYANENNRQKHRESILKFIHTDEYRKKQALGSQGRSKVTSEHDALLIRYRFLCGDKINDISVDFPNISKSTVSKIGRNYSWKHLPYTKGELYNMLINYQTKEESLEGLETR